MRVGGEELEGERWDDGKGCWSLCEKYEVVEKGCRECGCGLVCWVCGVGGMWMVV